jgi:tetratricopeptide (TPR) repeat protein
VTARTLAIAVAIAAAMAAAAPSTAQAASEAEKEARAHFQAGEARFKAGAFDEALAEYQKGYESKPLPGFLVNIAQCQRRLGDLKAARATYQKFVLVAPDSPLIPQVRSMITEIDGLLEKEKETGKAPADPNTDAEAKEKSEVVTTTPAAAAPADGAPVLVDTAPAAAPAPKSSRRWLLWGAIGAVVVGGAATAIVLSSGDSTTTIHDGSLATLRR